MMYNEVSCVEYVDISRGVNSSALKETQDLAKEFVCSGAELHSRRKEGSVSYTFISSKTEDIWNC